MHTTIHTLITRADDPGGSVGMYYFMNFCKSSVNYKKELKWSVIWGCLGWWVGFGALYIVASPPHGRSGPGD
jgi:hypothetical protein